MVIIENYNKAIEAFKNRRLLAHMDEIPNMDYENINIVIINDRYGRPSILSGINDFIGVLKKDPDSKFSNDYRFWNGEDGMVALATTLIGDKLLAGLYSPEPTSTKSGYVFDGNNENLQLLFVSDYNDTLCSRYKRRGIVAIYQGIFQKSEIFDMQNINSFLKQTSSESLRLKKYEINLNEVNLKELHNSANDALQILSNIYLEKNNSILNRPVINEVLLSPKVEELCGRIFSVNSLIEQNLNQEIFHENLEYISYAKSYLENYSIIAHLKSKHDIEIPIIDYALSENDKEPRFVIQKPDLEKLSLAQKILTKNIHTNFLKDFEKEFNTAVNLANQGFEIQKQAYEELNIPKNQLKSDEGKKNSASINNTTLGI